MKYHGISWNIMKYHGNIMKYHEISWKETVSPGELLNFLGTFFNVEESLLISNRLNEFITI